MTAKMLLTVAEAAAATPWGKDVIRRAIHSTGVDDKGNRIFPPPLKAKRGPRGQHLIRPADLQAWVDSLEDA